MDSFGQLIITGIKGTALDAQETEFLRDENVGGVILSDHNFEDPAQLAELVNSMQKLRDEYPLFISVEQEGGRASCFKTHFTQFPSMMELAKMNSPKLIFEVHEVIAKELNACGINLSFSPCCEVLTNPLNTVIGDRAFGSDVDKVENYISAAIRGLQTNGILACGKYFPGYGSMTKDPEFDLPVVKTSIEQMRIRELIPFMKASKSRVEMIMMGHMLVDALDDKLPTSLSPKAYQFLRKETKFSKIAVTDDMQMKAITDRFSTETAAVLAMNAGSDLLIYRQIEEAGKALEGIRDAVKKRGIKKELMVEKLARVERTKKEHFATYAPIYIPKIADSFNSQEAKKLLQQYEKFLSTAS